MQSSIIHNTYNFFFANFHGANLRLCNDITLICLHSQSWLFYLQSLVRHFGMTHKVVVELLKRHAPDYDMSSLDLHSVPAHTDIENGISPTGMVSPSPAMTNNTGSLNFQDPNTTQFYQEPQQLFQQQPVQFQQVGKLFTTFIFYSSKYYII